MSRAVTSRGLGSTSTSGSSAKLLRCSRETSTERHREVSETRVELPVDAHIPHAWLPSERVRLQAYQRIADAHDEAALAEVRAELVDRFGALPEPVERLFEVAKLRALVRSVGLAEVVAAGDQDPVLPRRAARVGEPAPLPALPGHDHQASGPYDPGAEAFHGAGGW